MVGESAVNMISVIVLNYNHNQFLEICLESVLNQTYGDVEIIVVDNGSTDQSRSTISSYSNLIKPIFLPYNVTQGVARNIGINNSNGEFLAFLDADDYWSADKLSEQVRLISLETSLIYSSLVITSQLGDYEVVAKYRGDVYKYFLNPRMEAIVIGGESSALISRDLAKSLGGFNPMLHSTAGWDFFRRCSLVTKFDYTERSLVYVRLHDRNLSKNVVDKVHEMRKTFALALIQDETLTKRGLIKRLFHSLIYLQKAVLLNGSLKTLMSCFAASVRLTWDTGASYMEIMTKTRL